MKAQLKCSNCGAEISNLNLSWGRKQWIWVIPFMILVILYPIVMNYMLGRSNNNFRSDIVLKDIEKRYINGTVEILGIIENKGKLTWDNIYLAADIFDKDGKFLDMITGRACSSMLSGTTDYFKISAREFPQARWEAAKDIKVKVTYAYHSKF